MPFAYARESREHGFPANLQVFLLLQGLDVSGQMKIRACLELSFRVFSQGAIAGINNLRLSQARQVVIHHPDVFNGGPYAFARTFVKPSANNKKFRLGRYKVFKLGGVVQIILEVDFHHHFGMEQTHESAQRRKRIVFRNPDQGRADGLSRREAQTCTPHANSSF